jgi:hypothetical protein
VSLGLPAGLGLPTSGHLVHRQKALSFGCPAHSRARASRSSGAAAGRALTHVVGGWVTACNRQGMAESSEYPAAFCRAIADAFIEIRRSNPGLVDSAAAAAPSPLLALPDIDRGSIFGHESSSDHELHDCDSEDMEASTAARSPEFAALRPPSILPASRQPRANYSAIWHDDVPPSQSTGSRGARRRRSPATLDDAESDIEIVSRRFLRRASR